MQLPESKMCTFSIEMEEKMMDPLEMLQDRQQNHVRYSATIILHSNLSRSTNTDQLLMHSISIHSNNAKKRLDPLTCLQRTQSIVVSFNFIHIIEAVKKNHFQFISNNLKFSIFLEFGNSM